MNSDVVEAAGCWTAMKNHHLWFTRTLYGYTGPAGWFHSQLKAHCRGSERGIQERKAVPTLAEVKNLVVKIRRLCAKPMRARLADALLIMW